VIYPRPTTKTVSVEREPVDGACPRCGAAELQRYPVLAETGWFDVVKCQACLHSVSRERGPLLGPVQVYSSLLADAVSS
jgi:vanillate/4-hydroxybenzoate decarboxylase subunit D